MSIKRYLKNRLPAILVQLLGMTALALFLLAGGANTETVLFISVVWQAVAAVYLAASCLITKKRLDQWLHMAEQLEETYLIAEVMPSPENAEEEVFRQILKAAERSMLEKIGSIQRDRKEYKEYIEQWIHEVKTPITALKLLCENNPSGVTREMLAELEHINRYTEQALYYARSEHTEKDYSIREIRLGGVIHSAVADNKYLLRRHHMTVTVEDTADPVYTDEKWVRFILNQLISNAVKYSPKDPALHFSVTRKDGRVLLAVEDNGIGIPESDLPRIFDKGFTGQNGRTIQSSTGIGLYLCRRLCDKLGIGITAFSGKTGTTVVLSFQINYFVTGVQS